MLFPLGDRCSLLLFICALRELTVSMRSCISVLDGAAFSSCWGGRSICRFRAEPRCEYLDLTQNLIHATLWFQFIGKIVLQCLTDWYFRVGLLCLPGRHSCNLFEQL